MPSAPAIVKQFPYEHKRGHSCRDEQSAAAGLVVDATTCHAYLIESSLGIAVKEGRIRYHADNVLVHTP